MLKSQLKKIMCYLIISLFISSVAYSNYNNKDNKNISQVHFIIDYNVNIYSDKNLSDIQKKGTFFNSITVLSDDVCINGRIKVKLQDGTEGWIEEKYTSYIPKSWKKIVLLENYYCYTFTVKKVDLYKDEEKQGKMYYYSNSDIDIAMGVNFFNNYQQQFKSAQHALNMQIQGGRDKKLNWSREFILGNYKVNYIITTDHEEGGISESFDFVKLDDMNLKKCYTVAIDYMPYESAKKKLMWRKMLFSTLQSLK